MDYKTIGHNQQNTVIDMIQAFYPNEKYRKLETNDTSPRFLESKYENGLVSARFFVNANVEAEAQVICTDEDVAYAIKCSIYKLWSVGKNLPWGILTGIRPAKIALGLMEGGMSDADVVSHMQKRFMVSYERAVLCVEVARAEQGLLEGGSDAGYSLYIGIPFCPSKCLYCSFTSYPIDKYTHLTQRYIGTLKQELDFVVRHFDGAAPEAIYIGGGTPTSLDDASFSELLKHVRDTFDLSKVKEYTVEAGRPDTITEAKLDLMKAFGVGRISINTQSINDGTLVQIGREHTAAEFIESYELARKKGFEHINIDLILGLPGECEKDVENTFKAVTALEPDEITVHTLAIKRASRLKGELADTSLSGAQQMESFLGISKEYMDNHGFKPYYMYRQKNSLGNFENAGYRKAGFGCLYNVQIMEESCTIAAVGAGAISKFVNNKTGRIERAFNVRDVDEYIERIDEMLGRKKVARKKVNGGTGA